MIRNIVFKATWSCLVVYIVRLAQWKSVLSCLGKAAGAEGCRFESSRHPDFLPFKNKYLNRSKTGPSWCKGLRIEPNVNAHIVKKNEQAALFPWEAKQTAN
jgi:hypothetical protein